MRKSRIAEIEIIVGNPFICKENGIFPTLDFGIEAESRESSGLESPIIPSVERESKFDPGRFAYGEETETAKDFKKMRNGRKQSICRIRIEKMAGDFR